MPSRAGLSCYAIAVTSVTALHVFYTPVLAFVVDEGLGPLGRVRRIVGLTELNATEPEDGRTD